MIINSLSLTNFRSYEQATLDFPQGSVLLSGDVGSGKTSILLAIEFALFGINRGDLPASSLLRHSADQGSVTLDFSLENTKVSVSRTLKRSSRGVNQGAGTLSVNGVQEHLTPVELRAKILDLLGYPESLLSKAKNLLFRYTVYTPQEEMKSILADDPEIRLDTLRKLFAIDQYKTVKDNAGTLLREFRAESKALATRLEELPFKKKSLLNLQKQLAETDAELLQAQESFDNAKNVLLKAEDELAKLEEQAKLEQEQKQKRLLLASTIDNIKQQIASAKSQLDSMESLEPVPVKEVSQQAFLDQVKTKFEDTESKLQKARARKVSAQTKLQSLSAQLKKVSALQGTCPTCQQGIADEHKTTLAEPLEKDKKELESVIEQTENYLDKAQIIKESLAQKNLSLTKKHQLFLSDTSRFEAEKKRFETAKLQQKTLEEKMFSLQKNLTQKETELASLPKKTGEELDLSAPKASLKKARELKTSQQVHLARLQETKKQLSAQVKTLEEELVRFDETSKRQEKIHASKAWLQNRFVPAADHLEKSIFSTVHHEFTSLFTSWFAHIIEDDNISVTLDSSFTPLISQNSYDTTLAALSGGEKTAVALAYRLALNHVINHFLTTIHTRDLLILDEPTDGFSTHQLDKLRDLFETLELEQIIVVSHESKVEGFVENILRVEKNDHSSIVLS